jgi:hypothetical protein
LSGLLGSFACELQCMSPNQGILSSLYISLIFSKKYSLASSTTA